MDRLRDARIPQNTEWLWVPGLPKARSDHRECRVPRCTDGPWDAWSDSGVQGPPQSTGQPRTLPEHGWPWVHGAAPGAGTGFGMLGPYKTQGCTEPSSALPGLCEAAPGAETGSGVPGLPSVWNVLNFPGHEWASGGTDSCSAQSSPEVHGYSGGELGNHPLPPSMNSSGCTDGSS